MAKINLPHEIMQFLLEHYSDLNEYTLLNTLVDRLKIGKTEKIKANKLRNVLELFESKDFLKWQVSKESPGLKGYFPHESYKSHFAIFNQKEPVEETLLNNHVSAKLTTDGLDYAIEMNRKRIQHRTSTIITPMIAVLALLIAFANVIFGTCSKGRDNATTTVQIRQISRKIF
ncbi:MAG: hypothetical protein ABIP79_02915 [Chitinophagaceae bacterium]